MPTCLNKFLPLLGSWSLGSHNTVPDILVNMAPLVNQQKSKARNTASRREHSRCYIPQGRSYNMGKMG